MNEGIYLSSKNNWVSRDKDNKVLVYEIDNNGYPILLSGLSLKSKPEVWYDELSEKDYNALNHFISPKSK